MIPRRYLSVAVFAVASLIAACDGGTTTTTATPSGPDDGVVFGNGELPETIPEGFPLPTGSVVGSTMVIADSGFTEVIIRVSADLGVAVQFYAVGLPQAGFTVDSSTAGDNSWLIEFSKGGAKGTLDISEPSSGISQALLRYNVP